MFRGGRASTKAIQRLQHLYSSASGYRAGEAAGWDGEEEVPCFEARLRRDVLRELRLLMGVSGAAEDRLCLDDPYELLEHVSDLFAAIVGRVDECPDAINTAWIRQVTPREDDSNRSRWDTDPLWRVGWSNPPPSPRQWPLGA